MSELGPIAYFGSVAFGGAVWFSFLPFGGRVDFCVLPVQLRRRIMMYAAGVGAALLAATMATLLIPVGYQLLRVETPLSFSVFCLIDLFGRAPERAWSDGTAIRGLLAYRRYHIAERFDDREKASPARLKAQRVSYIGTRLI